jgi:hypothetical protein
MKKPSIDDGMKSTSLNSLSRLRNAKPTRHKKNFFQMRNIIKKVKTHGMKFFTCCLANCADITGDYKKTSKRVYKSFKSDICKSRNRYILDVPMYDIMSVFSNIDIEILKTMVKDIMRTSFNFLLNLSWGEFLECVRKQTKDIYELIYEIDSTIKLTPNDVKKYYDYIYQGIDYKQRSNNDDGYIELYDGLRRFHGEDGEEGRGAHDRYIQCYEEL